MKPDKKNAIRFILHHSCPIMQIFLICWSVRARLLTDPLGKSFSGQRPCRATTRTTLAIKQPAGATSAEAI